MMNLTDTDNTQKFTGRAQNYAAGRPNYAKEFIDWLYTAQGFSEASVVADIGSGTGKFSEQLLSRGSTVFCVEPNDDMRSTAEKSLQSFKNFRSVRGTSEATTLPDHSCDFVTAAQAFQWFDPMLFRAECRRVLKRGGTVFLIWNARDKSQEFNRRSFDVYAQFCPNFHGFEGGILDGDERISSFFGGKFSKESFDNPLFYDESAFINRSLSASYSLTQSDPHFAEYKFALSTLFAQYADGDSLTVANKTVVYFGTV